ncbi:MAG: hypothetical protein LBH82_00960 [Bacteroidales bacterium]|jgi:hypothetical protein|nr:hypothetical protein [Bacteroidales bacterium]
MKKTDILVGIVVIVLLLPFFLFDFVFNSYKALNEMHPYCMAFVKFAVLATFGEMLAVRIKSGKYYTKGFGVFPRMIVWGLFGVWIAFGMKVFASGVPSVVEKIGVPGLAAAMGGSFSVLKLAGAFCISTMMNTCFAPVFMTVHKITDAHIVQYHGKAKCLITPVNIKKIFPALNWDVQWNFVFKKTIPLFWIPAHTLTFILPPDYQVLFAALLSVALGLILAFASLKPTV